MSLPRAALLAIAARLSAGLSVGLSVGPLAPAAIAQTRAGADAESTTVAAVETVTVEAARAPAEDIAAFATTLSPEQLVGSGDDLSDLLRQVPGVRVFSYGGVGRYATVSQRGSTAEQVAVAIDGVVQNSALGGAVDLSFVPLAELDSVTVFRGFAPAASGVFGLGGLIDIRTRAASRQPRLGATVASGSLGFRQGEFAAGGPAGAHGAWRAGVERMSSDGDYEYLDLAQTPLDPRDDRLVRRRNNKLVSDGGSGAWWWDAGAGQSFHARLGWRRRSSGVPGAEGTVAHDAALTQRRGELNLTWTWRGERGAWEGIDLLADAAVQSDRLDDRRGELGLAVQDETTRRHSFGVAGLLRLRLGTLPLTARIDLRRERAAVRNDALESADRGGLQRRVLALSIESVVRIAGFTLAPAVHAAQRRDDFYAGDAALVPPPAVDDEETRLVGKLGLAHRLGPRWEWRGSVGRFERAPSLEELFGDRGAVVGNPRLRPERALTFETGVAWSSAVVPGPRRPVRAGGELAVFVTTADELILLLPNSQGTAIAQNVGAATLAGLELAATLEPTRSLQLRGSATLQKTRSEAGFTRGRPLPGRPRREASLAARWRPAAWTVGWELTYVGSNPADRLDTPQLRLPARVLHDLSLARALGRELTATLSIQNLFDRRTYDVARFPLPGRLVYAALRWDAAVTR